MLNEQAQSDYIFLNHSYTKSFDNNHSNTFTNYIHFAPDLASINKRLNRHIYNYEECIQTCVKFSCKCCHKFLFPGQELHLRCDTETSRAYAINVLDNLCSYCYQQISAEKIPKVSYHANMLDVGVCPLALKRLSNIEKRFISLIQVFMTIIQLPGGQYAERGSVVNFISPYVNIARQLPAKNDIIAVRFKEGSPSIAKITSFVSISKIKQALIWLKQNNPLYAECNLLSCDSEEIANEVDFQSMNESCVVPADYNIPDTDLAKAVQHNNLLTLKRIDSSPISPYEMENGEQMAFPWLFPKGINGYFSQRPLKLTLKEYFHVRMNNISGIFRKDIPYLFSCVNICDYQQMQANISIHMRMRKPQKDNSIVTAKDIKHLQDNPDLLQNSYMFLKGIRGTVAYWKNALSNLLAMLKTLGPPTLFVTLSADDCHWPELAMALTNCAFKDAYKHTESLRDLIRKDPYMTALHFERRYNALFKHILKSDKKPLGEIVDFFVRLEFQNRGSAHYHIFYWIKDIPVVKDKKSAELAVQYIEKTISTSLPNTQNDQYFYSLVKRLQTHAHSDYCLKNRHGCRFGFPFSPVEATHFFTHYDLTLRGKLYATKRSSDDAYINAYNPTILRHFRSKMDIQFINNAESAAYYVCAYLCKAEPDELKREFSKLITDLLASKESITLHSKLFKIGSCVLKNRRLSAQEAAFRMSNLKLVQSSRNIVYLNCKPQTKRMKVLKPLALRSQLPDDSTDIFHTNIIDYYHARPYVLEDISLFMFASNYQICSQGYVGQKSLPKYKLLYFEKWIRQKRIKNVIRLPKFIPNSEDYYFSLLLLLLPHRNEEELLEPFLTAEEALFKKKPLLDTSYDSSAAFLTEAIENAVRLYRLTHDELAETFLLSSLTQPEDVTSEMPTNLTLPNQKEPSENVNTSVDTFHSDYESDEYELHSLQTATISEIDLLNKINQLTSDQRQVFEFVKIKMSATGQNKMRLFVSGGAGVGKTFLLKLLADYLSQTTALKYGENPILLTAPTGTAARNIHGQTLHSALCLPIENNMHNNTHYVSAKTLNKLRQRFAFVHTLFIDEVSMVSAKTLTYIHGQLCRIKDNDEIFGDFNMIVFGDFFQLRPVHGRFAFENHLLWQHFTPFILTKNMRQASDDYFIQLLNRARIGQLTPNDVTKLKSLLVDSSIQPSPHCCESLHLFPKRRSVQKINDEMLHLVSNDIITIPAIHFYSQNDVATSQEFSEEHIPPDDRNAGGMPHILRLSVGSRIMLLRNIFTSQGLVNGALGKIEAVEYSNSLPASRNIPARIFIIFDDPSVGAVLQQPLHHNAIEPCDQEYFYKGRCVIRRQFPLNLAWAVTIHKSQGASLDKVYCDLGAGIFEHGMAYVAMSRVRTLQGLHLYKFCPAKVTANPKVIKFYAEI